MCKFETNSFAMGIHCALFARVCRIIAFTNAAKLRPLLQKGAQPPSCCKSGGGGCVSLLHR